MPDDPYRKAGSREPEEPAPDHARPWLLQTWVSRRTCPGCAVPLFAARKEGHRIDACGSCGGAWLPHDEAIRMVEVRSAIPALLSDEAARAARDPRPLPEGASCPDCSEPLVRASGGPALVDTCEAHGTWFDAFELRAVAEATIKRSAPDTSIDIDQGVAAVAATAKTRDTVLLVLRMLLHKGHDGDD